MNPRIDSLLNRWLDGELSEPEAAAIQRMLVDDPEARRAYYELLMVDRMLNERIEGQIPDHAMIDSLADGVALGRPRRKFHPAYLAAVALVVLSLFAGFLALPKARPPHVAETGPRITGSTDSRMTIAQRQDSSNWAVGELLRLERGTAAIRLNPTVAANFEGPAAIELVDATGNIRLLEGMASFEADKGGNDFEVQVPGGVVRDMRARFSAEVLTEGVTNLRVDSGFLEIKRDGVAEPVQLRGGDAVRFEANGKAIPIRLPNQHFRSGLAEEVVLFRDDFNAGDGLPLNDRHPQAGQAWKVNYEENPTFIRGKMLDTTGGERRIFAPFAQHECPGTRTVYIFTFHFRPPTNMANKLKDVEGLEYISLADSEGKPFLSIFAAAINSHRWQLRDETSKQVTALTSVCALWTHSLTLCYDLEGRATLHDGATAQSPIIAELSVTAPIAVGGLLIGNEKGGDMAFSGIEVTLLPSSGSKP